MTILLFAIYMILGLSSATCNKETKGKRRAWHTFNLTQKAAYINAELCLMRKPACLNLPGTRTRFDEFQATHRLQAYATHFVGAFLPFHRAMLYAHEAALRSECNYTDWQPYWEEQLDAGHFMSSAVLHDFGGPGSGTGDCITSGPFANYTNHLGPGYEYTEHCINRQINETMSALSAQEQVDICLGKKDWLNAWTCIEDSPHIGGHGGVGALMFDGVASPGDPLFYLHHTWLDKLWADWQARDLPKRLTEMGGNNVQGAVPPAFPPRPPEIPQPTGADGDPGNVTTLNHVLNMYGNGPNRTIEEVMDIWNGVLCYEYVEPGY